ncbi:hypothetical protein TNCV_3165541 [Trichonephila clavipes]|nr:hypothetical protein TNCV_3165541 [Trichonephila clavipes]
MGTKLDWGLQTDHLIGASALAPQCPMIMYTGMGTVFLDEFKLETNATEATYFCFADWLESQIASKTS